MQVYAKLGRIEASEGGDSVTVILRTHPLHAIRVTAVDAHLHQVLRRQFYRVCTEAEYDFGSKRSVMTACACSGVFPIKGMDVRLKC